MSEKIRILITYPGLPQKFVQQIRRVSERIAVEDKFTDIDLLRSQRILDAVKDAEIIFGMKCNKEMFLASRKLKWFHSASAGVEKHLFPEFVGSDVILTSTSGIHRISVSEMVIAHMLVLAKQLHKLLRFQLDRKWQRLMTDELADKTVGIIGLGNVGMETAWKAKIFSKKVLALDHQWRAIKRPTYVDEILRPEDLDCLLSESDYLIITVPLTRETHHMIGERELKLMKPSACIINVSRGAVIHTAALVKALKEGWIGGAGLDVFEQEPLPENSELWDLDNVIITPHVSGISPHYTERAVDLFCRNLARYLAGRPLVNVVDKKAGY